MEWDETIGGRGWQGGRGRQGKVQRVARQGKVQRVGGRVRFSVCSLGVGTEEYTDDYSS